jgi:type II secretory ATPase GspE/PulE/Tfp pilus assembly ATPase PilB-like protein
LQNRRPTEARSADDGHRSNAIKDRADRIELVPRRSGLQVSREIAGESRELLSIAAYAARPLVDAFKLLAGINPAVVNHPGKGRAKVSVEGSGVYEIEVDYDPVDHAVYARVTGRPQAPT